MFSEKEIEACNEADYATGIVLVYRPGQGYAINHSFGCRNQDRDILDMLKSVVYTVEHKAELKWPDMDPHWEPKPRIVLIKDHPYGQDL